MNYSCIILFRSLDFAVALLQKLMKEEGVSMEKAVEEAYNITLKPWHRWISSAAFRVIFLIYSHILYTHILQFITYIY